MPGGGDRTSSLKRKNLPHKDRGCFSPENSPQMLSVRVHVISGTYRLDARELPHRPTEKLGKDWLAPGSQPAKSALPLPTVRLKHITENSGSA